MSKASAVLSFAFIYLVAILVASASHKYLIDSGSFLKDLFYADLVGALTVFAFCVWFNTFSIYDPYWTIQASVISVYYIASTTYGFNTDKETIVNHLNMRSIILFFLVNLWSIRLTSNLFINSVEDVHFEDWRYSDFRKKFPNRFVYTLFGLTSFILLPTVVVFFGCIPMYYAFEFKSLQADQVNLLDSQSIISIMDLNLLDLLAFVVTFTGIIIEGVADHQLRQEVIKVDESGIRKNKNGEPLPCMNKGLWGLSRHPNYFGEITFWFGLYIFGLAAGASISDPYYLLTFVLGPLGVFIVIYFGSMPLMEERQQKRRPKFYRAYMQRVPNLLLPINFTKTGSTERSKTQ